MSAPATRRYDLVAIGSGPAGRRAAIEAAHLGGSVALVERRAAPGGASTNTGTLPFRTLRAAAIDAMAAARGGFRRGGPGGGLTLADLLWRADRVIEAEHDAIRDQLRREHVEVLTGRAVFTDPHTIAIRSGGESVAVITDRVVIAVGTVPARPPAVDVDGLSVLDPEGLPWLEEVPRSVTVVGAGVAGLECASVAAALGARVTLVDRRMRLPEGLDEDIARALIYHLRGIGVTVRAGEEVDAVTRPTAGGALAHLASGGEIASDALIYAAGRTGATADLGLAAAGLAADGRGRIAVDHELRTAQPHIFAAGDVIGARGGTATAMEEGRRAAIGAFGRLAPASAAPLPQGLSTIPEISSVGETGRDLADAGVPHVSGMAPYRGLRRGQMSGDPTGLLKLLVHARTRRILGVHILGTSAAELVHVGQALMAGDLPLEYLLDTVLEVPTYTEAYSVAALDAADSLRDTGDFRQCDGGGRARLHVHRPYTPGEQKDTKTAGLSAWR